MQILELPHVVCPERDALKALRMSAASTLRSGLLLMCLLTGSALSSPREVTVGILAYRGDDTCLQRWEPTIRYLNQTTSDARFRMEPLDLAQMSAAVQQQELDFVLTNPGNYVELERRFGVTRIATLKNLRHGQAYTQFGGVIFTGAARQDVRELSDLRNKSFGAVSEAAFGGFQMAWRELKAAGLDPYRHFSELRFFDFPQDAIVLAVRDGVIDAGTVRTDVLERMAIEGQIRLEDFRVLNIDKVDDFPFAHSTRLYPEWAFARTRTTPELLGKAVAIALMKMPGDSPAAVAGNYAGWTVPLTYQPVHDLFRDLQIGPYRKSQRLSILEVARHYWEWLALILAMVVLTMLHNISVKRQVKLRTRELRHTNLILEQEVAERKRAEEGARNLLAEKRFLAQKCMAVQEDERRYLARELHDELGQCITAIQADAETIQELSSDGRLLASAGAIQSVSARIYAVVHSIMERLRPSILDDLGLVETLNEEIGVWQERQPGTKYRIATRGNLAQLGDRINISMYRIVQECLTNVAKHAMASDVTIDLAVAESRGQSELRLVVTDDGVGMSRQAIGRGLGLIGIRERVEALDGTFDVSSSQGTGTRIAVTVPLQQRATAPGHPHEHDQSLAG
jgi:two-component system sensor histidine kinase TtrS